MARDRRSTRSSSRGSALDSGRQPGERRWAGDGLGTARWGGLRTALYRSAPRLHAAPAGRGTVDAGRRDGSSPKKQSPGDSPRGGRSRSPDGRWRVGALAVSDSTGNLKQFAQTWSAEVLRSPPLIAPARSFVYWAHVAAPFVCLWLSWLHRLAGRKIRWRLGLGYAVAVAGLVGAMISLHSADPRSWNGEGPRSRERGPFLVRRGRGDQNG